MLTSPPSRAHDLTSRPRGSGSGTRPGSRRADGGRPMHRYDSGDPAAVGVEATAEELAVQSQVLLEPFRAQGLAIRSMTIANAGSDRLLSPGARIFRISEDGIARAQGSALPLVVPNEGAEEQDTLA